MKHNAQSALVALAISDEWTLDGNDYSGLTWLDSSITKPTETEINNKIAELDAAEPMRLLREKRNKKLFDTDWRASTDLTLSDDWKNYRQALRDLPATASPTLDSSYNLDPSSITWPTEPS